MIGSVSRSSEFRAARGIVLFSAVLAFAIFVFQPFARAAETSSQQSEDSNVQTECHGARCVGSRCDFDGDARNCWQDSVYYLKPGETPVRWTCTYDNACKWVHESKAAAPFPRAHDSEPSAGDQETRCYGDHCVGSTCTTLGDGLHCWKDSDYTLKPGEAHVQWVCDDEDGCRWIHSPNNLKRYMQDDGTPAEDNDAQTDCRGTRCVGSRCTWDGDARNCWQESVYEMKPGESRVRWYCVYGGGCKWIHDEATKQ